MAKLTIFLLAAALVWPSAAVASSSEWEVVQSPNLGQADNSLADVAAVSALDVWAVGSFFDAPASVSETLVEHWDGTAWSVIAHPDAGTGYSSLTAVSAESATDVWAVGSFQRKRFASEQSLIMRWNGAGWTQVTAPNRPGWDAVSDVSILSEDDGWIVGNGYTGSFVARWNGSAWELVSHPNVGWLQAVHAVSPDDVWAVGQQTLGAAGPADAIYGTLAMHWDGSSWTVVQSPNVDRDFNFLEAVAGSSSDDLWAVGAAWDSTKPFSTLILHWNGTAWSIVPGARVGRDSNLFDVLPVSSAEVWAVGTAHGQSLIERWDGRRWRRMASPAIGTEAVLAGISGLPSGDLWAVGASRDGGPLRNLAVRRIGG